MSSADYGNEATSKLNMPETPCGFLGDDLSNSDVRMYSRKLVIIDAPGKAKAISKALGMDYLIVATKGNLRASRLNDEGLLEWCDVSESFFNQISAEKGLINEVLIATDDDIAGELIGMHAAEIVAQTLGADIAVRRMRFHSLDEKHLNESIQVAGDRFDADFLAAALTRELLRHVDLIAFQHALAGEPYAALNERATVAMLSSLQTQDTFQVHAVLEQEVTGQQHVAFIANDRGALAVAREMTLEEAEEAASAIKSARFESQSHAYVRQVLPLYPSTTTQRALEIAADELGILPWDAQDHLNAMYQQAGAHDD